MVARTEFISSLRQCETANSVVFRMRLEEVVAGNQRVVVIYGVVKTGPEIRVAPRDERAESNLQRVQQRIQHGRPDQIIVIGFVAVGFKEEGSLALDDRTTDAAAKLPLLIGRALT